MLPWLRRKEKEKKESNRRACSRERTIYPDTSIITWQFMENKMSIKKNEIIKIY